MFDYTKYNEQKYKDNFWSINRSPHKWFSNYVKLRLFKKWIKDVSHKKVFLDIGGGVGNWAFHFLPDFKQVIVLDVSKKALQQIPEKNIVKKVGSATKLPFKNNSADYILLADVLEHIVPKDLPKVMSEAQRVVTPQGRIVIFTSEYGYGITLLIKRIFRKMKGRLMKSELTEGHLNRMTFQEIKALVKNADLEIDDYYHYSHIFQQSTDFLKDTAAHLIDKSSGKSATREGQVIKDKLKRVDKPSLAFRLVFGTLSLVSYLDILLFGKWLPGGTIFLSLKKAESRKPVRHQRAK